MKYFILFTILYFSSCSDSCEQTVGQPFRIEEGKTYCLPGDRSLTILEVSSSYCPCDVMCVWEGETTIRATLVQNEGTQEEILIHEVLKDENDHKIEIASIEKSDDCEPVVISTDIVVTQ